MWLRRHDTHSREVALSNLFWPHYVKGSTLKRKKFPPKPFWMELYCKGKEMWEASSFLLEHTTFQKGFTSEKKKRFIMKGRVKVFPFRVIPFSEMHWCTGMQTGSHKITSLVKRWRTISWVYPVPLIEHSNDLTTVKLQWLVHLWDHGNLFETWVVRATRG